MWWTLVAALAAMPEWTACVDFVDPLTWDAVGLGPEDPMPYTTQRAARAADLPEATVTVNATGALSGPLPTGQVRLVVDPDLPAGAIVALYEQLAEAGSEPTFLATASGPPAGLLSTDSWLDWPTPPTFDGNVPPLDAWADQLRRCKPGKAIAKGVCPDAPAAWRAVLADERCALDRPLTPVVTPDRPAMVAIVRIPVDPTAAPVPLHPDQTWADLEGAPPAWVVVDPNAPAPGPVAELEPDAIELKKHLLPTYPTGTDTESAPTCLADVRISAGGVPERVEVRSCPAAFRAATQAALMKWRWYPPKVDRQKTRARVTISVTYEAPDAR